ncbi:MAG: mucoidy inhibitor MuiA family protein [Deltaproteobacteria bacterium]|nr:mucoidy inhibitor MuiA family protein [Deltaproteobacteria bacterium]
MNEDGIQIESRLERVELFRKQALVTRRGRVRIDESPFCARIGKLPAALWDSSVRLRLDRPEAARLVDLHVGLRFGMRDRPVRTEGEQRLRELDRKRMELELERKRRANAIAFLNELGIEIPEESELPRQIAYAERQPFEGWLALGAWLREELDDARARIRALDAELREQRDRIAELAHELRAQSRAELEELAVCRKEAAIWLEAAETPQEIGLELSYLVPAAGWAPEYELRVFEDRDRAELVLKALVAQRSGEDWRAVEMACSTADLERSAELPELDSWRIGKAQPARATGWRELPEGLDELFEGYDRHRRGLPSAASLPAPELPAMPALEGVSTRAAAPQTSLFDPAELAELADRLSERPVEKMDTSGAEPAGEAADDDEGYAECEEELALDQICLEAADMRAAAPEPRKDRRKRAAKRDMAPRRAMPPPAPAPACAPAMMAQMVMPHAKSLMAFGRGGGPATGMAMPMSPGGLAEEQAEEIAALAASREALGYADLRMQGPDEDARGQLRAVGPAARLREQLGGADRELAALLARLPARAWSDPQAGAVALALPRYAVLPAESAGHFAVRYPMESPAEVRADGQVHNLTLLRRQADVQRLFRCVPLLDDKVYQVAELENPLAIALLAGPVRVFRGGDFVVTAPLETTAPGKRLTVNLGVEPGIRVARNLHFRESTEGLFGGETRLQHEVQIEVRSNLARPARVEIFERVPVSDQEDVKVEITRSVPEAKAYDQADRGQLVRGGLRFAFDLAPGQKRTCVLEYAITIPSKHVLAGGNRRG